MPTATDNASPTPTSKTVDELFNFKEGTSQGYFHIPAALITTPELGDAKLGDAWIVGEPGGDLTKVFTDMHDMARFLVLFGYDIHWVYEPLSTIREVLKNHPQSSATNVFFFFAGHGQTVNQEGYEFLGNKEKPRSADEKPLELWEWLPTESSQNTNFFICLATCIKKTHRRGPNETDENRKDTLTKIFNPSIPSIPSNLVLWAPISEEEEDDKSDQRITQKLLKQLRNGWIKFAQNAKNEILSASLQNLGQDNNGNVKQPVISPDSSNNLVLLRANVYSRIAYYFRFSDNDMGIDDADDIDSYFGIFLDMMHREEDVNPVHRFWRRYAKCVDKAKISIEIEIAARYIAEALSKQEPQSDLETLRENVETLLGVVKPDKKRMEATTPTPRLA